MKVSIIIPVYCVEKYIKRCLQSVAAQTFRNIECILVDDCGKDNSMDIVQQFVKNYVGDITFTIVHHDVNQGPSAARNTGIRAASGDYVFFLDSDDSLLPYSIMTLAKLAKTYPDADFVQGNILDSDGNVSPHAFDNSIPEYCAKKEKLEMLMLHRVITSAWNRLIKRSTILDHNLFFPIGLIHEDMYWTYFFTKQVKAAAFTTIGTYTYYTNEESIMTASSKAMHIRRYESRMIATKDYLADIRENGSNVYQRQYVAVNLLSCLVELFAIRSIKYWISFWSHITAISFLNIYKTTLYRFLFLLCLMPPFCFFAGKRNVRWRIQKYIVSLL